jgi:hypothetical protein
MEAFSKLVVETRIGCAIVERAIGLDKGRLGLTGATR